MVVSGPASSVPVNDYSRTAWCLIEEVVMLRELFVRRKRLPGAYCSSSLCLFFSGHERAEGKGRSSRGVCRISYRELIVKGQIDPVSTREGHMRGACYGSWGDREWQQREERRDGKQRSGYESGTAIEGHRVRRLADDTQDPRGGHPARGPPGRPFR